MKMASASRLVESTHLTKSQKSKRVRHYIRLHLRCEEVHLDAVRVHGVVEKREARERNGF